jgi:hypothetical protein
VRIHTVNVCWHSDPATRFDRHADRDQAERGAIGAFILCLSSFA